LPDAEKRPEGIGCLKVDYLIFCSFEVGGLPYAMADILNRHGVDTVYLSSARSYGHHDSRQFHYGDDRKPWDWSSRLHVSSPGRGCRIGGLKRLIRESGIRHCLATGIEAWKIKAAGLDYHYWSFGSDLDQHCFKPLFMAPLPLWRKTVSRMAFYGFRRNLARRCIRRARKVMVAPYQKSSLDRIAPGKALFFFPHFLKVQPFDPQNRSYQQGEGMHPAVKAHRFFFSSSRQVWSNDFDRAADQKGNDVIIRAFVEYGRLTGDLETRLVLVRKGPDADHSQKLGRSLGLGERLTWLDEMKRDDLTRYYRHALACLGQFGTPVITGAAIEPLACGTPCISWFGHESPRVPYYDPLPPIVNVNPDPAAVASAMKRLVENREYRENLAMDSRRWVEQNCSEEAFVKAFVGMFDHD
jgi:glycosyltransferase involved in cell wall biosynthesis